MMEKCDSEYHALQDQTERIHLYIEKAYQDYHTRHAHRIRDGPSQTHLQVCDVTSA